ncbi:MAG TPA: ABC transporter permease [Candidatus Paceibacterota bacterium]|nr:ABC transporter permease [Candidatus Paceibacterota bacterium]
MEESHSLKHYPLNVRLKSLYIIWYRELLIYWRNRIKVFTSIFLPLLLIVFFGAGFKAIFPTNLLPYDFSQFFYPGILSLSTAVMAMSSTLSIVWDREFGFLREILVSPIPRSNIVLGKILGATTVASIQGGLLLLVAPYLSLELKLIDFIEIVIFLLIFNAGVSALGVFFASGIKKTESFSIFLQIVIAPMSFLSGAFFPLNNLPLWIKYLAHLNPFSYGADGLRWLVLSSSLKKEEILLFTLHPLNTSILFLIIFDIIIFALAIYRFKR